MAKKKRRASINITNIAQAAIVNRRRRPSRPQSQPQSQLNALLSIIASQNAFRPAPAAGFAAAPVAQRAEFGTNMTPMPDYRNRFFTTVQSPAKDIDLGETDRTLPQPFGEQTAREFISPIPRRSSFSDEGPPPVPSMNVGETRQLFTPQPDFQSPAFDDIREDEGRAAFDELVRQREAVQRKEARPAHGRNPKSIAFLARSGKGKRSEQSF